MRSVRHYTVFVLRRWQWEKKFELNVQCNWCGHSHTARLDNGLICLRLQCMWIVQISLPLVQMLLRDLNKADEIPASGMVTSLWGGRWHFEACSNKIHQQCVFQLLKSSCYLFFLTQLQLKWGRIKEMDHLKGFSNMFLDHFCTDGLDWTQTAN